MNHQSILNSIRQSIDNETVSMEELYQLQFIVHSDPRILANDPRLAEWAGIPEIKWRMMRSK